MSIWERSTLKTVAVMAVIAIVAAACVSSDPGSTAATPFQHIFESYQGAGRSIYEEAA